MCITTSITNTNTFNPEALKVIQELQSLKNKKVEYGFFSDKVYLAGDASTITGVESFPPGTPVAFAASIHEFGVNSPKRDFFSSADIVVKKNIFKTMRKSLLGILKGNKASTLLNDLGEMAKSTVEENILNYPGNNSDITIHEKGFDDPLYWSGRLSKSVAFRIKSR